MSKRDQLNKKEIERLIVEITVFLPLAWEENFDKVEELFKQLVKQKGVMALVKHCSKSNSVEAIHLLSAILSHVLWYPKETNALYWWIEHLPIALDDDLVDSFAIGIRQHFIVGIRKPPSPKIWRIMFPILLRALQVDDWTVWMSSINSLCSLDTGRRLEEWLTIEELTDLKEVLNRRVRWAATENLQGDIGSLHRLLDYEPDVCRIMFPTLLQYLNASDEFPWGHPESYWSGAIETLNMLDSHHPIEEWLNESELTDLKVALQNQIKRATEEWQCRELGRLQRFLV